jgi:phosphoribulokinase
MSAHAAELRQQVEAAGAERENGREMPFVLGIVGDSGSGKNTVADAVRMLIGPERVTDVRLDDYHRYTRAERLERNLTALNPAVHDLELMREHLQLLRSGRSVRIRSYEHANGTFGPVRTVEPRDVVIVRGLLGFPTDEHRAAYDLAVFLEPEPDLLFRWKLRRDVRSRGYTQAEVLKNIAQHLLDAKEFVLPQAQRADLVVQYRLPDHEEPDTEVRVRLHLRRTAAEALTNAISSLDRFGAAAHVEHREDGVILELTPDVDRGELEGWATERFPTFSSEVIGVPEDDEGQPQFLAPVAFVEVLIARLTQKLRRVENVPA